MHSYYLKSISISTRSLIACILLYTESELKPSTDINHTVIILKLILGLAAIYSRFLAVSQAITVIITFGTIHENFHGQFSLCAEYLCRSIGQCSNVD